MKTNTPTTIEAATYQPHQGSIPDSVINYFRRFPDEELSHKDIAIKYDCDVKNVKNTLAKALESGCLSLDGSIYGPGPNIGDLTKPALKATALPAPVRRATYEKKPRVIIDIDVDAIVVNNTPAPVVKRRTGVANKWRALLDRLETVGQWVTVPIEANVAIGGDISKLHKVHPGRFRRAKISATEMIVERVA